LLANPLKDFRLWPADVDVLKHLQARPKEFSIVLIFFRSSAVWPGARFPLGAMGSSMAARAVVRNGFCG
jgi:hypothetical protein